VWLLSWFAADWLSSVILDIDGCSSPLTSLIREFNFKLSGSSPLTSVIVELDVL
jgi:hypothetical protein